MKCFCSYHVIVFYIVNSILDIISEVIYISYVLIVY